MGKQGSKAAVIGVFDGVHKGHVTLIASLIVEAENRNLTPIAITFDPPPSLYFNPHFNFMLSAREEKEEKLREHWVEDVVFLDFSEVTKTTPRDFISNELIARDVCFVVVGETFRFGYRREGDVATLEAVAGLEVATMPKERFEDEVISATRIRELLLLGHIRRANHLLGYEYALAGRISKGLGRAGALLDTPTVNLEPSNPHKLVPPDGIYAVRYGKDGYPGVCYIGSSPTFGDSAHKIEVHLLESPPSKNEEPRVSFVERLRPEMRFETLRELKTKVLKDVEQARRLLCE